MLGFNPRKDQLTALESYFIYYTDEVRLLRKGLSEGSWQTHSLAVKTVEDVFHVVDVLRNNSDLPRPKLRQILSLRFASVDDFGLNSSINLAIRLWLMINTQEPQFEGLRHEATAIQWNDESTLRSFLHSLFPRAKWQLTAQSSRLSPHFTAVFMQRICGLRIEWTTSLHDHLRLDRRRKALKVFSYKYYAQTIIEAHHGIVERKK
ncbi:MAG: hypothetical protein L6R40_004545 [Gallowayella cf. fulva]|nr:MAG: hypothetical protein L6R40_004545 [Xanthomendoza cf. fulva]